ncbi:nuclear pore complex protein Nup58 isoform X2 [Neocloeon triangulifer]|uniref:nuclear pore complex protein Nup58 isoform X2 n=1 Tax=Neocloeon triangulifer TaxID=2078957 RepID=UPI00286F60CD|nr:nuclear pore complex protein Nup58 isoform X2 [Neocloeon triangulifer]
MSLGFPFGQPAATSAPPAFGAATSSFSFGSAPAANPQQTFGAPASSAPSTGLNFGSQPTASVAPLSFAGATGAPSFGAATSTVPGFGAPASSISSFGAPISSAPTFGAPAASVAPTFGAPTTSAGTGFSFGAPASAATSLPSFGAPTSSAPSLFGASATPAATGTLTAGLNFGGFGGQTLTSQPSLGGGLGGGLFGATSTANSGGLFGAKPPAFGAVPTSAISASTATPAFTGLGGQAVTLASLSGGLGSNEQKQDKAVMDQDLPQPILQCIEEFKNFVKQQKNISSDIARSSCRPSERASEDIESIKQSLFSIRNDIQNYSFQAKKLKGEADRTIKHAEMAQQTQIIAHSMQDKHFEPDNYFGEVVSKIEEELKLISQEVDSVERVVQCTTQNTTLKKEELVQTVKRLHEIFIAVASKLQQVHSNIEQKKEQYAILRQQITHDSTDVFQQLQRSKQSSHAGVSQFQTGPSLFSNVQSSANIVAPVPAPSRQSFTPNLGFGLSSWK